MLRQMHNQLTVLVPTLSVYCLRPAEIKASDIGTRAGLFQVEKIGDEFYSFVVDCKEPKACTILLRGASKETGGQLQSCSQSNCFEMEGEESKAS